MRVLSLFDGMSCGQQALESYKGDVLDEFEKWVESAFVEKIGGERVFNETFLLSKIRSLKTKTI